MSENTKNSIGMKILKEVWEWTYTILIAVAIAFVIKAFLFDIVKVDGQSMERTLQHGDRLIVTKLGYEPEQGDIIILDSTYKARERYFKEAALAEGKQEFGFFVKKIKYFSIPKELKRRFYVKRVIATPGQTVDIKDGKVYVDGEVLEEEYYKGETYPLGSSTEYPLMVEENTVFVMGDNRGNSTDSRSSALGLVPYEAVLGKAQIRFFPFNKIGFTK